MMSVSQAKKEKKNTVDWPSNGRWSLLNAEKRSSTCILGLDKPIFSPYLH